VLPSTYSGGTYPAELPSSAASADNQIGVEVGYVLNFQLFVTKIQMPTVGTGHIGVMLGDTSSASSAGKNVTSTVIEGCTITPDGANSIGLCVMPSRVSGGGNSQMNSYLVGTGTNSQELFDFTRYFRNRRLAPEFTELTSDFLSAPNMYNVIVPTAITDARGFGMQFKGDTVNRIEMQLASTAPALRWSAGTAVDVVMRRLVAGIVEFSTGTLKLQGVHTAPLWLGNNALWVDATGDLRIKAGTPTSDTDGTVVGTQT
jgi:hypothetical protein